MWSWPEDFSIGSTICVRVQYHLCSADAYTRTFFSDRGLHLGEDLALPEAPTDGAVSRPGSTGVCGADGTVLCWGQATLPRRVLDGGRPTPLPATLCRPGQAPGRVAHPVCRGCAGEGCPFQTHSSF